MNTTTVIMQFPTRHGATVNVTAGGHGTSPYRWECTAGDAAAEHAYASLPFARDDAKAHAETCQANPQQPATDDEPRITALAAARYVANTTAAEARKTPDPAATMDDICTAWPEVAPQVLRVTKSTPQQAEVLTAAVANWLRAHTAVEHARAEAGDGYGFVFDLLVEGLEKGADPDTIRTTALDMPRRIRNLAAQSGGTR
ncbi:hypothetical protein [Streptomyces antibioticus]|uniref:hypothetical protein n=1 Tax=Streptomyces antibioticus TaxID=1890 RepID=UPI0033A5142D